MLELVYIGVLLVGFPFLLMRTFRARLPKVEVIVGRDGIATSERFTSWDEVEKIGAPGNGWFIILTKDGENRGVDIRDRNRARKLYEEASPIYEQARTAPEYVPEVVSSGAGWLTESVEALANPSSYRHARSAQQYVRAALHPCLPAKERVVAVAAALVAGVNPEETDTLVKLADSMANKKTHWAIHAVLDNELGLAEDQLS